MLIKLYMGHILGRKEPKKQALSLLKVDIFRDCLFNNLMHESPILVQLLSWTAVFLLSISYWFQIWKIHVHKEVRDLSMIYHILLATGFGILTYTAWLEGSTIFIVKQIMTTIPVLIIIYQIISHKDHHWHDDNDPYCTKCKKELEPFWDFCAYCGTSTEGSPPLTALVDVVSN